MSKDSNLPALSPAGGEAGLNRYLAEIRKFPLLTAEQEYMLAIPSMATPRPPSRW